MRHALARGASDSGIPIAATAADRGGLVHEAGRDHLLIASVAPASEFLDDLDRGAEQTGQV